MSDDAKPSIFGDQPDMKLPKDFEEAPGPIPQDNIAEASEAALSALLTSQTETALRLLVDSFQDNPTRVLHLIETYSRAQSGVFREVNAFTGRDDRSGNMRNSQADMIRELTGLFRESMLPGGIFDPQRGKRPSAALAPVPRLLDPQVAAVLDAHKAEALDAAFTEDVGEAP